MSRWIQIKLFLVEKSSTLLLSFIRSFSSRVVFLKYVFYSRPDFNSCFLGDEIDSNEDALIARSFLATLTLSMFTSIVDVATLLSYMHDVCLLLHLWDQEQHFPTDLWIQ